MRWFDLMDQAAKDLRQLPRWTLVAAVGQVFAAAVLAMLLAMRW